MGKKALIIVDVQNDFCSKGALAVKDGEQVVPIINLISGKFDRVIATQDWHPLNHVSFASNHKGRKPFEVVDYNGMEQALWPNHCVQGTKGAEFHKDLNLEPVSLIVKKGTRPELDSYSAFLENDRKTETGLQYFLMGLQLKEIYLCGLATDYCVFYSALDAVHLGFDTTLILDACRGVDFPEGNIAKSLEILKDKGVKVINHDQL